MADAGRPQQMTIGETGSNNRSLSRLLLTYDSEKKWGVVHAHGFIFGRAA